MTEKAVSIKNSRPIFFHSVFATLGVQSASLHSDRIRSIQLVSIGVTIIPGRGPFLLDGTVPGMDQVQYECTFVLRNLTDKGEEVQVGFPVDSQFARESEPASPKESSRDWVLDYGFIALDETTTYNVEFIRRKRGKDSPEFSSIFVWKMNFAPRFKSSFPVEHPWWFRQITPTDWNQSKAGVQWTYKDFKPKDPIEVRYYMTELPNRPEDVGPFLEQALRAVGPKESAAIF